MKKTVLYRREIRELVALSSDMYTYAYTQHIRDLDMQFMRSETGKIGKMLCNEGRRKRCEEEEKDARQEECR